MKLADPEQKQKMVSRLRRIEGQVRGVQNMVDEERDCKEIFQQIAAIRSALQSASMTFLEEFATQCLLSINEETDLKQRELFIKDLVTLIGKAP